MLYISRGTNEEPFDKADMELLSACAVHLSLVLQTADQLQKQRHDLWSVFKEFDRLTRAWWRNGGAGLSHGECLCSSGPKFKVSDHNVWRLQIAGLIHHLGTLMPGQTTSATLLAGIEALEDVAPLIAAEFSRCL